MTKISEILRKERETAYRSHENPGHSYIFWRNLGSYEKLFAGNTLSLEPITFEINRRLSEEIKPVKVLDLGAGIGEFLLDCKRKWGEDVDCVGITALGYKALQATSRDIYQQGIRLLRGDIHHLEQYVPRESIDIAISVFTFEYLSNPWVALKRMHDSLKIGGIGMISGFDISANLGKVEEIVKIDTHLKNCFDLLSQGSLGKNLVFRKTKKRMKLPFKIIDEHVKNSLYNLYFPRYEIKT